MTTSTISTARDLSWLDDADIRQTAYQDTEGITWTRAQVEEFVASRGLDARDYFAQEDDQPLYLAWAVLDWLGY